MAVVLSELSSVLPLLPRRSASFLWPGIEKNFLSPDGIHYRQISQFTERLTGGVQGAAKRYDSVSDLVHDISDDAAFADELDRQI